MMSARAKIEKNYVEELQDWEKTWRKYLRNETTEYGMKKTYI